MNQPSRISDWAVPLIVLSAAATYVVGVYLPGRRALARLGHELVVKEDFIAQAGTLVPAIDATKRELEETVRYNQAWLEAAPSAASVSQLFGHINSLAKDSGAVISRFDPEPVESHDRIRRIPVEVECGGTFPQVYRFLQQIESLPQVIWIDNLRIEKDRKDGESVKVDMSLEVLADNPEDSGQAKHTESVDR
jgi:Tfp pilus assembly protein PilO